MTARWLLLGALGLVGCGEDEPLLVGGPVSDLEVVARSDGRVDFREHGAASVLEGGWAEVLVEVNGNAETIDTRGCGGWEPEPEPPSAAAYFAEATGARLSCERSGVLLTWRVWRDAPHEIVVAKLGVENQTGSEVRVLRLTPLVAAGEGAGLRLGDPARLRILDNGSDVAGDVDVKLHYADEKRNAIVGALLPIESRGAVVSNWSHAIDQLDDSRAWVAGSLGVERSIPTLGTVLSEDGNLELYADNALDFDGKRLAAGASVDSEAMYFAPLTTNAQAGLESYADAMAAWLDFTPWTKRDGGRRVPNGWNSWGGGSGTGGLGTDINETNMGENLEVMARELAPFGIDYFQLDDGYQLADGDWFPRPDRFPAGMEAWSKKVKDKGLIPGLWISAFTVDDGSTLAKEHPELLADPNDNVLGGLFDPGGGKHALDLSNDAALDWLADTMSRYKDDWGMGWIKLDFAYLAFAYRPRHAPELTSVEVYKRAIRKFREVLGDDVFYLGIALMGVNYGVVDSMRVTLDTEPRWEEPDPFILLGSGGNFKSSVKSAARRYWLHDRVWENHDDLLFFRTDESQPEPQVTEEEAITLASFIGLSGSIVKFGEDLRTLTPEQIQIWRKLLPVYGPSARPLDLFTRMYPERWVLDVNGTQAGSDARWKVLGLFNWGRNWDYTANVVPEEMDDATRSYTVELSDLGLSPARDYLASEFWSESFLGVVRGSLTTSVPAHGHQVIALRESSGHPQFLGHNRQLTQGGTDLGEESWDAASRTLTLSFDLDQGSADAVPFEYRFRVYVPEGYAFASASAGQATQNGQVVTVALTPKSPGRLDLELVFDDGT
ncbi:MAG: alpha-galactosidase [Polyangiaceae bacterium]|nr:alpha-galactosidase [Polyangiaceae bacterium]